MCQKTMALSFIGTGTKHNMIEIGPNLKELISILGGGTIALAIVLAIFTDFWENLSTPKPKPMAEICTREDGHGGPCNGLPRDRCLRQ